MCKSSSLAVRNVRIITIMILIYRKRRVYSRGANMPRRRRRRHSSHVVPSPWSRRVGANKNQRLVPTTLYAARVHRPLDKHIIITRRVYIIHVIQARRDDNVFLFISARRKRPDSPVLGVAADVKIVYDEINVIIALIRSGAGLVR